jgi:hypothetical protein
MADYDRLGQQTDWRPYVMFFHKPDFKSQALNTDGYGFRVSHGSDGKVQRLDHPLLLKEGKRVKLVVGNSVAFGVGASTDAATLSSQLSLLSGDCWLNFSGRAFGSIQELLLFQHYRGLLPRLDEVVIFSGSNDLYQYFLPKQWDNIFGVFSYSERFYANMREDPSSLSPLRALLHAGVRAITGRKIDARSVRLSQLPGLLLSRSPVLAPEPPIEQVIAERMAGRDAILQQLERNLEHWHCLSQGLGFRLRYVLQPIQPWTPHQVAPEEAALMDYWGESGGKSHKTLRAILQSGLHRWFAEGLDGICRKLGIGFQDMNEALGGPTEDWLFIDSLHMTDACNRRAAEVLLS